MVVKKVPHFLNEHFSDARNNTDRGGCCPLPFPFLDVFTWAVLSGKKELAKLLWEKGTQPIATALFATKLLKEMVRFSQDEHQIIDATEGLLELAE
jgi:hypothetical protein